jgi:CRISPR-associated protein Csb3
LELAERLWGAAEGWFDGEAFFLRGADAGGASGEWTLPALLSTTAAAPLRQIDQADDFSSPVHLSAPFDLRLDWWTDDRTGGGRLKPWAGSMRSVRIARAVHDVLSRPELQNDGLLNYASVVYDPLEPDKKVEPFYFDARRGSNARPLDIGFSPDSFHMTNTAYPAVEFLCLVGLQRFRPLPTDSRRRFDYHTWTTPLATRVAPLAACGLLPGVGGCRFRFETAFRTDQNKHKAFTRAVALERTSG